MSSHEVTRRKFITDTAKYCGAGVAAMGLIGTDLAHGGKNDLEIPAQDGMWRMRDASSLQSADWRRNAHISPDLFKKNPELLINGGQPVDWSHLQSVKGGIGYAKKDDDVKRLLG